MDVCALLSDDTWVERKMKGHRSAGTDADKLIKLEQFKFIQARAKIAKIQEGFEGGLYDLEEAKRRTASYHDAITKAGNELKRISSFSGMLLSGESNHDELKQELRALRDRNLDRATFEEKVKVVTKLGIEVYPAEDLRTMRVKCRLGHGESDDTKSGPPHSSVPSEARELPEECGIVSFAPPQ